MAWTRKERQKTRLRPAPLRPSAHRHALEHADSTPFFAIGDTWYSVGTNRFKWYDDDRERPLGPAAGFKDYVRDRQAQGFNLVNVIAAFPNWMTDPPPWHIVVNDPESTTLRPACLACGNRRRNDMDKNGA